jgi:hypothetical protein
VEESQACCMRVPDGEVCWLLRARGRGVASAVAPVPGRAAAAVVSCTDLCATVVPAAAAAAAAAATPVRTTKWQPYPLFTIYTMQNQLNKTNSNSAPGAAAPLRPATQAARPLKQSQPELPQAASSAWQHYCWSLACDAAHAGQRCQRCRSRPPGNMTLPLHTWCFHCAQHAPQVRSTHSLHSHGTSVTPALPSCTSLGICHACPCRSSGCSADRGRRPGTQAARAG